MAVKGVISVCTVSARTSSSSGKLRQMWQEEMSSPLTVISCDTTLKILSKFNRERKYSVCTADQIQRTSSLTHCNETPLFSFFHVSFNFCLYPFLVILLHLYLLSVTFSSTLNDFRIFCSTVLKCNEVVQWSISLLKYAYKLTRLPRLVCLLGNLIRA